MDEVRRVGGYVRDRGVIDVDTVAEQTSVFVNRVPFNSLQSARRKDFLGGLELFRKEIGVAAGAGDGAALLVHADEKGNGGIALVCGDFIGEGFGRQPASGQIFEVLEEQKVSAQVIF